MSVSDLSQEEFIKATSEAIKFSELDPAYIEACRLAAAEGAILLKNNGALPIAAGTSVSVFGRVQYNYFYVGYGSGGDVKRPYAINLIDGLRQNDDIIVNEALAHTYEKWCQENVPNDGEWGTWPTHYEEMPLKENLVQEAAQQSETAIVVIGRSAGEDRESLLEPGSYYLTAGEKEMLERVTTHFSKVVVVINTGNNIDYSWIETYGDKINAVLIAWQGGMESGNAVADVLSGKVNPSGRLTSTIARNYKDYPSSEHFGGTVFNNYVEDIFVGYRYFETFAPETVLFPFGFGLSYSNFNIELESGPVLMDGKISLSVKVTNTGIYEGKEVIQVYYKAPCGVLGKPARELAAFAKTTILQQGQSEILTIDFDFNLMASYDDAGKTGHKSAWVLEAGDYQLFVGNNVRSAKLVGALAVKELTVVEQVSEAAAVDANRPFERLVARLNEAGHVESAYETVPTRTVNLKQRILDAMPQSIATTDEEIHFDEVIDGTRTIEAFIATLNMNDLEGLTRGDFIMNSPLGAPGNAGTFGGMTESLRAKGVMPVTTCDGPSGLRLQYEAALIPIGMALASTWNMPLLLQLATFQGAELKEKGSHILLAPGMNIMRDPLCGRNFEYFSEDPVLNGRCAISMVQGLQTYGDSACPKHFAANNQERFRNTNDSRISERALREIYLKGFELCVKEAAPKNIMTSYNKINGVWGHYHYELCQVILRQEWGYKGNIMTDWWMQGCGDPDFEHVWNDAYRVRAGVDVLMPGGKYFAATDGDGSLLASYEKGGITLGEIQRTAKTVLQFILDVAKNSASLETTTEKSA